MQKTQVKGTREDVFEIEYNWEFPLEIYLYIVDTWL